MSLDFIKNTAEFKSLLDALDADRGPLDISGIGEAAKPYFLSMLLGLSGKRLIVVRPSTAGLSGLAEQMRFSLASVAPKTGLDVLPALAENPYLEFAPALEAVSSRMKTLHHFLVSPPACLVTNLLGLLKPLPGPEDLKRSFFSIEAGNPLDRDEVLHKLSDFGYVQEDLVNTHGEFAKRGGIVDVFSPWEMRPFRLEFGARGVESLREFEPASQKTSKRIERILIPSLKEYPSGREFIEDWISRALNMKDKPLTSDLAQRVESLENGEIYPSFAYQSLLHASRFAPFSRYLPGSRIVIDGWEEVSKEWTDRKRDLADQYKELLDLKKFALPPDTFFPEAPWNELLKDAVRLVEFTPASSSSVFNFPFQSAPKFQNQIPFFLEYLKNAREKGDWVYIFFSKEGIREKIATLLGRENILHREADSPFDIPREGEIMLLLGHLELGFAFPREKITFFAESDIFTEERVLVSRPRTKPFQSHFQDLKTGDFVVHTDYGVGRFHGLVKMALESTSQEFIELRYKDEDKLFVPVADLNLVQKYTRPGSGSPTLNKLGTPQWERTKARTKKAIETMAKELLDLYARRQAQKGYAFALEGAWQEDFSKTFEFEETDDQLSSIRDIFGDMERDSPMDRLLCGDVGYGKTEVALRAAFKATMDGKQVAVLCPTTVLASQHIKTFRNRLLLFPVRVEGLTRLQSRAQQRRILTDLKEGRVDILIGTHRLLSKDVIFKDLGLLIVDEEQRFGVFHKEKIKQIKTNIDVLTMTATPIPRTLNLSLTGLRDISLIETPPKDRLAIHTVVTPFSAKLITAAIKTELARGGQVYFIHNRVEDIDSMALMLQKWVPAARTVTVHGQMSGPELEKRMLRFIQDEHNVLVSTTIIENGIDIPKVNTLIVNRADRFGLAQLYQLRGRVGRSSRQAVAYFLVPPYTELTPLAKARLKALQEFSELGSGFRLAAKDLEIRGAGNFLGTRQHGYMEAVGFDYYMMLLEQTVKRLQGGPGEDVHTEINLKVDIRIPEDYLPQMNLRLNLYKRISSIERPEEIETIRTEIRDRYGPIPSSVETLMDYGVVKFLAQRLHVRAVDRIGRKLVFKFLPSSAADVGRLAVLLEMHGGTLTPQGVMTLPLSSSDDGNVLTETITLLKELSQL